MDDHELRACAPMRDTWVGLRASLACQMPLWSVNALRAWKGVWTCLLALICLTSAVGRADERYYFYNPLGGSTLYVTGLRTPATRYTVTRLEDGRIVTSGSVALQVRNQVPLNNTGHFVLETTQPLLATLSAGQNKAGSQVFPTTDGKKFYGTSFVISLQETSTTAMPYVIAAEPANITLARADGVVVLTRAMSAGEVTAIIGLSAAENYKLESTGLVAFAVNAQSGFTAVPPVPVDSDLDDCNNDLGRRFYFATYGNGTGAVAVFNPTNEAATFTLNTLSTITPEYVGTVNPGDYVSVTDLDTGFFRLQTSSGKVVVWAGEVEGGSTIDDMGDDLAQHMGDGARAFLMRSQNGGASIYAIEDGTLVSLNGIQAEQAAGTVRTVSASRRLEASSNKPILIQSVGGNTLNDFSMTLRPVARTDSDRDGRDDVAEGGSCRSVAPDLDLDGLYNYEDSDDDGDGVGTATDNCPILPNLDQLNTDGDAQGNVCDTDDDNDSVPDGTDSCPQNANADQQDLDDDGLGDACDPDDDGDGILDDVDSCPEQYNTNQADQDQDGQGDVCDPDDDGDEVADATDLCPFDYDPTQADSDDDQIGDVCDPDDDGDGVLDELDICPLIADPAQSDLDGDGVGDLCEDDLDGDGILDDVDVCPEVADPAQEDLDNDDQGDFCDSDVDGDGVQGTEDCNDTDSSVTTPLTYYLDSDADGYGDPSEPVLACQSAPPAGFVENDDDNCPDSSNPSQADSDNDGAGDVCDADADNDGTPNDQDNCPLTANTQQDTDGNGTGDACEHDQDGDGWSDALDTCPELPSQNQQDSDQDGAGDICDADDDNDGIEDALDNCPFTANADQTDLDVDGEGAACDPDDVPPTPEPTPTLYPTETPVVEPTPIGPTATPVVEPTPIGPTETPVVEPTPIGPTATPSASPMPTPTATSGPGPESPTTEPTTEPTVVPTAMPTPTPSIPPGLTETPVDESTPTSTVTPSPSSETPGTSTPGVEVSPTQTPDLGPTPTQTPEHETIAASGCTCALESDSGAGSSSRPPLGDASASLSLLLLAGSLFRARRRQGQ